MKQQILPLICSLMLGAINVFAQLNPVSYTVPLQFSPTVWSIAVDSDNNIWCGTSHGVAMFDGTNWTTYTTNNGLLSNSVNNIRFDGQGKLWVCNDLGVSIYDGNTWVSYDTTDGLPHKYVYDVAFDNQGNAWFGTSAGVAKFNGTSFTVFNNANTGGELPLGPVRTVFWSSDNKLWCGINSYGDGGAASFDGTTWTGYNPESYFKTYAEDSDGNLWVGGGGMIGYIYKYNGTSWIPKKSSGCGAIVNTVVLDHRGNIWATSYTGLHYYNDTTWADYDGQNVPGLPLGSLHGLAVDHDNNLWIGEDGLLLKIALGAVDVDTTDNDTTTTDLISIGRLQEISVYPNPASNTLHITLDAAYQDIDVTMTDLAGKTVGKSSYTIGKEIEFNLDVNPGLYLVHIRKGAELLAIRKIIVE